MTSFHRPRPIAILVICLGLYSVVTSAAQPSIGAALSPLAIDKHGELMLEGDDITYAPWQSDTPRGKVHVIQYLAATKRASEIYKPLTDQLPATFEPGTLQFTSIINLDAALWGTSGFVMSEIKKNKRKHPDSAMVMDKTGKGAGDWGLGKKGSALLILDPGGVVRFFTSATLDEAQVASTIELLKVLVHETR